MLLLLAKKNVNVLSDVKCIQCPLDTCCVGHKAIDTSAHKQAAEPIIHDTSSSIFNV